MIKVTLEDIIRQFISLPTHPTAKGFYQVNCKVCNDHGKKGLRAGFKFDGDVVGYSCFNCTHTAKYDPSEYNSLSDNMKKVLEAFNIPLEEAEKALFSNLGKQSKSKKSSVIKEIEPDEIKLPPHFYLLSEADKDDKWATIAKHYLLTERLINPNDYPFYLSTGEGRLGKKWKGRIIFPIYKNKKLIYYQGRDMTDKMIKKYESPSVEKCKILYNYDILEDHSELPIFVVEGFFDAFLINGIALCSKQLSKEHIIWLNRNGRQKIVIPDRFGDGRNLAQAGLDAGWAISTPDFGECKDVTDAIKKYGKLYIMDSIMNNIKTGFDADLTLRLMYD